MVIACDHTIHSLYPIPPYLHTPYPHTPIPPYLDVIVRVPVRVVDDDGIGCGEVDTETTGTSREKKRKLLCPGSWEERGRLTCSLQHVAYNMLYNM